MSGSYEVRVSAASRHLVAGEWILPLFAMVLALIGVGTIVRGGPVSLVVLLTAGAAVFTAVAVVPFRRPVGILFFRSTSDGVEFPGSPAGRDLLIRVSPVLLLGPLEALRLALTGGAGEVPTLVMVILLLLGGVFVAMRRDLRTWRTPGITLSRRGVEATAPKASVHLGWMTVPQPGGGSRPLRRVVADPPRLQVFPDAMLLSDSDAVAAVIEFYRANPAARAELGTPAAVERLRRFDVDGHP